MARDESEDLAVDCGFSDVEDFSERLMIVIEAVPWEDRHEIDQNGEPSRYVPFAQLETECEVLRDVKREAEEIIARLRKELAELNSRRARMAKEVFHKADTDGTHVLARACLQYECDACGEVICADSGEPFDGLDTDLNGQVVKCKCGAEYVGVTPDTSSLFLLEENERNA